MQGVSGLLCGDTWLAVLMWAWCLVCSTVQFIFKIHFMCMCAHMCVGAPGGQKKKSIPRAGVPGSRKLPSVGVETILGSSVGATSSLNSSSFQPLTSTLFSRLYFIILNYVSQD